MPTLRSISEGLWYKTPRSAQIIVNILVDKGYLIRWVDGKIMPWREDTIVGSTTIEVPLIGSVACWKPIFAEENIEAKIPVSTTIARPPYKYFFLRAKGDSMNQKGINDGDLILVKEQHSANDRDIVVALIDDEATVKELREFEGYVALMPHSTNDKHKPIILHEDFLVQGIVTKSFPGSIF